MSYRMVVIDLDGTLLNNRNIITKKMKILLKNLVKEEYCLLYILPAI